MERQAARRQLGDKIEKNVREELRGKTEHMLITVLHHWVNTRTFCCGRTATATENIPFKL